MANKDLTTYDLARIMRVAPRTVSKLFDSGELRGYRVNENRRVPLRHALQFARRVGMEDAARQLESLALRSGLKISPHCPVLVAGPDPALGGRLVEAGFEVTLVADLFALGLSMGERQYRAVVLDTYLGQQEVSRVGPLVAQRYCPGVTPCVVIGEDADPRKWRSLGFPLVWQRPVDGSRSARELWDYLAGDNGKRQRNGSGK